jgi:hypothetical protein
MVIKEAAPTLVVYIMVAISTPRDEWVKHGIMQLAENRLEESERIGEASVVVPAKVEGLFGEGHMALPAGIAGATTMTRPSRPWRWWWPDPSSIVCL